MAQDYGLITLQDPASPISESYRTLRMNLQFATVDSDVHTLLVTSPGPGEGKSTTLANLAVTMAQVDRRVSVVDADLRRPYLHTLFGLSDERGLTTMMLEDEALANPPLQDTAVPGLRVLQKYAVRCGGGVNHRLGLGDAALIKDNHVAGAGSVSAAYAAVKAHAPTIEVEVECDTVEQVREAVEAGADLILLDNMSPDVLREAVAITGPRGVRTEASGGLVLADAAAVGATGVDYISVGALTHSSVVLDLGFDLRA